MGALTPVTTVLNGLGTITTALNTVGAFGDAIYNTRSSFEDPQRQARQQFEAQQNMALQQLKAQQSLDQKQAAQDAELQRQQLAITTQNAEETRQRALKRAVASQRAKFGASAIGSTGGSAEAVLLGLFDESEEERDQRERLSQLKSTALDTNLAQKKSLNVLQASQLKEKQQLERAIRF